MGVYTKVGADLEVEKEHMLKNNDALEVRLRVLEALILGTPQEALHNTESAAAGNAPLNQDTGSYMHAMTGG